MSQQDTGFARRNPNTGRAEGAPGDGSESGRDGIAKEAAEIEREGAFASQVAPRTVSRGEFISTSVGGENEQQDARRLHGQAADSDEASAGPDPVREQDEVGSANSTSSH